MNRLVALVLAALLLLTTAASASAAPRPLDPSFGDGGRVLADRADFGVEVAQAPGGRIYALAGVRLLAFKRNGAADLGFGEGGGVALPSSMRSGGRLTVDSQGRPVVAAQSSTTEGASPGFVDTYLTVLRFLPGGQLDPSFGAGGVVVTDLGLPRAGLPPGQGSGQTQLGLSPQSIATDRFDRVVVTGSHAVRLQPAKQGLILTDYDGFAARLQPNGEVDPSFGSNGVTVWFAPTELGASALAPDDSLFVIAKQGEVARVVHIDSAGQPDPDFGAAGRSRVAVEPDASLSIDGQGSVTVSGTVEEHVVLVQRLLANGGLDRSFGIRGALRVRFAKGGFFSVAISAADGSGGCFLAMSEAAPSAKVIREKGFLLAHVTRDGHLDRGFGRVRTGFGRGSTVQVESISVDGRGRPLLAGPARGPMFVGQRGLVMARYRPAG